LFLKQYDSPSKEAYRLPASTRRALALGQGIPLGSLWNRHLPAQVIIPGLLRGSLPLYAEHSPLSFLLPSVRLNILRLFLFLFFFPFDNSQRSLHGNVHDILLFLPPLKTVTRLAFPKLPLGAGFFYFIAFFSQHFPKFLPS